MNFFLSQILSLNIELLFKQSIQNTLKLIKL